MTRLTQEGTMPLAVIDTEGVPLKREFPQPKVPTATAAVEAFETFFAETEPRLRRALVAAYGPERGRDAAAEALAYAWEH